MTATTEAPATLTRAEAAYAHLASFQRGQHVIVSGRRFAFEGTVTTTQRHDFADINRVHLIVTGDATVPDGDGWQKVQTEVKVTVGRMLSGQCFTVATTADAGAGNWQYFDAATWAMRNTAV